MKIESPQAVRIDKWLWAVRLYKSRALAAEACRGGHVEVGGMKVKPAHDVRIGDTIVSRAGEITRTTRVLGLIDRRVGAQAAKAFAEDQTPPSEHEKPREPSFRPMLLRPKGAGRPTKKERRAIDELL